MIPDLQDFADPLTPCSIYENHGPKRGGDLAAGDWLRGLITKRRKVIDEKQR
jgi:hypothetical protein